MYAFWLGSNVEIVGGNPDTARGGKKASPRCVLCVRRLHGEGTAAPGGHRLLLQANYGILVGHPFLPSI